jgi:hypothetical protein
VYDFGSRGAQGLYCRHGNAHVGEELHAAGLLKRWTSSLASADA